MAQRLWLRSDGAPEWSLNPLYPSWSQFSILDQLEGMSRYPDGDNKILFELYWPELEGTPAGPRQLWKQSSNPVIGVPGAAVEGYEAVDAPYTSKSWGGLQRSGPHALLDGSICGPTAPASVCDSWFLGDSWWYAVGSQQAFWPAGNSADGDYVGIPGPGGIVMQTELYVHTPCAN